MNERDDDTYGGNNRDYDHDFKKTARKLIIQYADSKTFDDNVCTRKQTKNTTNQNNNNKNK